MKLIFLIAFFYLFWEFINRASVDIKDSPYIDQTTNIKEVFENIISRLKIPKNNQRIEVEQTIEKSLNIPPINDETIGTPDFDSSINPDSIIEGAIDADQNQVLFNEESIVEEEQTSSAFVSAVDIKEWTKRNQRKKNKLK